MNWNERISEDSYFTPRDLVKIWGSIFATLALVGSCSYWFEQDDKRMRDDFMKNCQARQIKNDEIVSVEKCSSDWYKAYRETFGRNP